MKAVGILMFRYYSWDIINITVGIIKLGYYSQNITFICS